MYALKYKNYKIGFKDRHEAGRLLAEKLVQYKNRKDAIILAIPRGGLVTGYEIARQLFLPLDILLTKKIGYPNNPEYAIGSVGPNKEYIINEEVVQQSHITEFYIKEEVERLSREIKDKYERYRGKKELPHLKEKLVIVTDDGVATGYTMTLSLRIVKKQQPQKIVAAIPVSSLEGVKNLKKAANEVVCLETPSYFYAISQFYDVFEQVNDEEAIRYLKEANEWSA